MLFPLFGRHNGVDGAPTLSEAERPLLLPEGKEANEAKNTLRFMPPPPIPVDPIQPFPYDHVKTGVVQGPFWFRDRQFIWFYADDTGCVSA